MPKQIQLPDGSVGEFPDAMPDSEIEATLRKQFPPEPGRWERFVTAAKEFLPSAPASDWPEFGPKFREQLAGLAKGVAAEPGRALGAAQRASAAALAGKPGEAAFEAAGAVPFVGPAAQQVGRDVAEDKTPEALGHAAALLAPGAPAMARTAVGAGSRLGTATVAGVKAAAPDVAVGTIKAGAGAAMGQALGELPGVGHVGRYVFAYPGAHQIATGIGKGATEFWRNLTRKPFVAEAKMAAVTAGPEAAESVLLDGISQAQAGRKFANLSPPDQAAVREIAARIQEGQQAPATRTPSAGAGKPTSEPGGPQVPQGTPRTPQEAVVPPELPPRGSVPRGTEPLTVPEEAYPRPAPGTETKPHYEQAARTVKARALARFLNAAGISPEDAARMGPDQWKMAAEGAGVNLPSPKSSLQAVEELRKMPPGSVAVEEFRRAVRKPPGMLPES